MIAVTVNNKRITLKTSWDEITLADFFVIQKHSKNVYKLMEVLSSGEVTQKQWKQSREVMAHAKIIEAIQFLTQPMGWEEMEVPDYYVLGDKKFNTSGSATWFSINLNPSAYKVPKDLGEETLAQKMVLQRRISQLFNQDGNMEDAVPWALAVYFQPMYTGEEFDEKLAADFMEDVVMHSMAIQAYPIGFFFVKKSIGSANWRRTELAMSRPQRRRRQKSTKSGKSLKSL